MNLALIQLPFKCVMPVVVLIFDDLLLPINLDLTHTTAILSCSVLQRDHRPIPKNAKLPRPARFVLALASRIYSFQTSQMKKPLLGLEKVGSKRQFLFFQTPIGGVCMQSLSMQTSGQCHPTTRMIVNKANVWM